MENKYAFDDLVQGKQSPGIQISYLRDLQNYFNGFTERFNKESRDPHTRNVVMEMKR